jgi:hypothetical protein
VRPVIVRVLVTASVVLALMAVFSSPHQYEYVGSVPRVHALGQKTVTSHGAIIDSSQSKFGGASAYLNGSTYVTVTDDPDFAFGTGNFTVDFWVRFHTLPSGSYSFFSQYQDASNRYNLIVENNGAGLYYWNFYLEGTGNILELQTNPNLTADAWYHIALVRSGDTWYIFQDGVSLGNATNSVSIPDLDGVAYIGNRGDGIQFPDGWLDEFRITKGLARWTSGFTPPTSAYTTDASTVLLIHFDSDFSDSSTTTSTMTITSSSATNSTATTTSIPPSPVTGFPIESILAGLAGGLIALTILRRRRRL